MMYCLNLLLILCFGISSSADREGDSMEMITQLERLAKDVKQEIIQVRNKVEERLRNLKQNEIDWLQKYFGLKKRIPKQEDVLEEAEENVADTIQTLRNERMGIRIKVHKYKVVHGGRYSTEITHDSRKFRDISFRANDALKTKLDGGENIILTNVPENNGNAYDNYTGEFIAPVTGTYYFVLQLCLSGNYVDLSIQKKDHSYSWARFFPYHLSCQTVDMLTPLKRGDAVYPSKTSSWDYDIMNDEIELFNTFSGVLIA